ncbi:MAG: hypothetical protein LUH56_05435 [Oscillospiraceae bacterium]|nr:hypothetical protein [Oscillospiraceae bacterium]
MKNTLLAYIDRFRHDRRQRVMLGSVLLVLAVIVTLLVYWQLRLSGVAMTNETYCGYEEHVHTDECYEYTLICELEETGHVHDESCYEEQQVLVCALEETEGHTHSESCYDEEGNLVCGLSESTGHTHDESCYETQTVLICGQEETPDAHVHTDECYEKTLICELEEHTHTVECLIDLTADVEDETIWSATIPELTGDLRTDIVAIAESQVGYTESTANYSLGEDGITHYGYTRYGAWYGSEYADWDSIFAAFCLDYAGIADEFSYNAGSFAWSVDLANLGYYQSADSYVPSAGDLVFIDTDLDGRADKTAVVVSVDNVFSTVTAIQGNYTVTDADGNSTDTVAYVTYSMTATAAPVLATISEDGETVDDLVPVILGYANVTYAVETTDEETAEDEVIDEEEIDLEGETDEEITDEEITDEITELEVVGSAAVLTYAGEDYTITVTYGEDALIPEGTYLVAYEYSSDSETYLQRYAESAAIYGWEGEPTEDFRVFNIGLYYDGVEIEPAAEIQVSITYTAAENSDSVSVTHHDDTAEPLYAVSEYSEETGTETVTFTTDGFSDYSVMLASTGAEENNGLTATSSNLADVATISWTYTGASYADGSFDIEFRINIENLKASVIQSSGNYTYSLSLPEDVTVPGDLVGYKHQLIEDGVYKFDYEFVEVNGVWTVVVYFNESYINSLTSDTASGHIDFSGSYTLNGSDTDDDGNIVIDVTDGPDITIKAEDVETKDNEDWYSDVSVYKTSDDYDKSENTITYTITVSSNNGTQNSIDISDTITVVNESTSAGAVLTLNGITINSITYNTSSGSTDVTSSYYDTDYTAAGLGLTLDALGAGESYVITYTVKFDAPASGEYDTTISNSVTATSTTDAGGVEDGYDVPPTIVTNSAISKTGDYDEAANTITWTIVYNSTDANIVNNVLYDSSISGTSFADAITGSMTINGTEGVDYEYVYESGVFVGIKFLTSKEYTITYKTDAGVSLGTAGYTARNYVEVKNEDGDTVAEKYANEPVDIGGYLNKDFEDAEDAVIIYTDNTNTTIASVTRILNWSTTTTVPVGGITKGTVFEDDLDGYNWSEEQWFSYSQIIALFETLDDGLTIGTGSIPYNSGANYTIEAYDKKSGTWIKYDTLLSGGASTYDDTSTYLFTAFRITFNDAFEVSGDWKIEYSTTADITKVYTGEVSSKSYKNTTKIGSLYSDDSYVENLPVYKTDGGSTMDGTTDTTVDSSGNLTWKVYTYIQANSTETYYITDTLPAGLTFVSAKVEMANDSATLTAESADADGNMSANFGWVTQTAITGAVTGNSTDGTEIEIQIPTSLSSLVGGGGYITITYTATIDGLADMIKDAEADANGTVYVDLEKSYTNHVSVKYGKSDYGEDDQTQNVDYEEKETGDDETVDYDAVDKTGAQVGSAIKYQVVLNIHGTTLNNGSNLTLTDIASIYYSGDGGNYNNALLSLDNESIAFYQLCEITFDTGSTESGTYVDSNGVTQTITDITSKIYDASTNLRGTVYVYDVTTTDDQNNTTTTTTYFYMEKISVAWTYSQSDNGYGWYYHTLTASIPDSKPILFLYAYNVVGNVTKVDGGGYGVSNTATLSAQSDDLDKDDDSTSGTWSKYGTSASMSGSGLTIYKVDVDNYDTKLENAKFSFEMYVNGSWVQVTYDQFSIGYDASTGAKADSTSNPMSSDNYIYTDENGKISLSSAFTYNSTETAYYSWYQTETLYRLVEREAPDGYELITLYTIYFYWSDDDDSTSVTYPSNFDTSSVKVYDLNETSYTPQEYVPNQPNTSFTLVKVSTTDTSVRLSGATYALYVFHGDADTKAEDGTWTRIGTYVTDANGEITITYDASLYEFNRAYKLVEVDSPEGYNIGYNDKDLTTFYFYWSSPDTSNYAKVLPSDWASGSTGTSPSEAIDIATKSESVQATNTKTTTSAAIKKLWVDESGNSISATGYSTEVKLYWYSVAKSVAETTSSSGSSSTANLVTISSTSSGATAQMYLNNNTNSAIVNGDSAGGNGYYWNTISLSNRASLISALYQTAYSDAYVQLVLQNADDASGLQLIIQNSSYKPIAQVSPTTVTTEGSYTYVTYSTSTIRSALISAGYSDADTLTADCGGICLNFNSGKNESATLVSFSVLASVDTKAETGTISQDYSSAYSSSGGWGSWFYGDSYADFVLTEGAVIKVAYTNATTDDNIQFYVGIQYNDGSGNTKNASTAVTASGTSGTVYVPVSRILSGLSLSSSDYIQVYVQSNIWASSYGITGFTGTITSLEILVPSTSTISSTTYEIVEDDDTSISLAVATSGYPAWQAAFSSAGFGNADLQTSLSTSGAIIRVYYTNLTGGDSTLGALIQSYYDDNNGTVTQGTLTASTAAIGTDSSYVDFYVDTFTADSVFDWNYFSWVYLYGYDGVTVTDVQVLIPYSGSSVSPSGSTSVTLYNPTTGFNSTSFTDGNYIYDNNFISKLETETTPVVGAVMKEDSTVFSGYGFIDAVYSDSAEYVVIELSNVEISDYSLLSYLCLVIQGDMSANYEAICAVKPDMTMSLYDASSKTATLYYSTKTMAETELKNSGYKSASDVYADYNGVALQLETNSSFSATLVDLKVIGTVSAYYTESELHSGTPYTTEITDEYGNVTGTQYYTYTLDSSNDWSVAVANLPLSYTSGGVEYYCYYYFVEDTSSVKGISGYDVYATYSQIEGEHDGGQLVIVNTLVEELSATVNKVWVDKNGDDATTKADGSNITVQLYYYLTSGFDTQSGSYLETDFNGSQYESYEKTVCDTDNWTWTVTGLPKYKVTDDGTVYTCCYYFVETATVVSGVTNTEYSRMINFDGSVTVTVTNTVSDDSVGYSLPSTGGQNERIYIFIGMALMVLALLGCAYRNIHRIRFSAASNDTPVRKPSKPGAPSETKLFRRQKKLSKDRNGDSRAGPKS